MCFFCFLDYFFVILSKNNNRFKFNFMVKKKLITARKDKNFTQHEMAQQLFMTQSQYQRREQGEIQISDEEWAKIAKLLCKEEEEIREDDTTTTIFNFDNQSCNYSQSTNNFYNIPDFIMKNQQDYIEILKEENHLLKTEFNENKAKYQKYIQKLEEEIHNLKELLKKNENN